MKNQLTMRSSAKLNYYPIFGEPVRRAMEVKSVHGDL